MMHSSTGGGHEVDLVPFEGLIHQTARMFAAQVGREEDDLAQELRVRVWKAATSFNRDKAKRRVRSRQEELELLKRYVYMAVANKIKDYKRDAARAAARRERDGVTAVLYIEDVRVTHGDDDRDRQEAFDGVFHFIDRDDVFREVDEGKFVLPSSVTRLEANVLLLLVMELLRNEIALRLGITRREVDLAVGSLRVKLADWAPTQRANSSQVVTLIELAA
jgi:DNA-directed RNA polymerase specialized sigma24 family protein